MKKIITTPQNLQVLYEDNHMLIVNKRAGDIVQGDKTGDEPLSGIAKQYIAQKYHKQGAVFLGVVHRLDRPTTGVVIFARTSKALARLNKMFVEKTVEKTYWALVKNKPNKEKATLEHWLKKNPKNNKSTAYNKAISGAKRAVLHYESRCQTTHYTLLEVRLETGRHHQIRCQLASIGSPIKGDLKYGFNRSNKDASIHLHARKITFVHPVKKEPMTILAPLPKDDPTWNALPQRPCHETS